MYKLLSILFLFSVASSLAISIGSKSLEPKQEVKLNDKYTLQWQIDRDLKEIFFEVNVETLGFVGFGLNSFGSMDGADIFIGGVQDNGETYFSDRHGNGTNLPEIDEEEHWTLHEATEDENHTFLKFSRKWDTCDPQDFKINDDTLNIIWSFGATDTLEYHGPDNRGTREYNFLDGPPPPVDISDFETWQLRVDDVMPKQHTSYWCTMHKSPVFPKKHHLVGFNTYLENEVAVKHTHHFIAARCSAPEGNPDELFGPFVGTPGGDCELNGGNYTEVKKNYCHEYLYIWAVGGEMMLFPQDVGFAIGEETTTEYILLEVHYDNPEEKEGIQYTTGFDVFYTDQIRLKEAELLIMGHDVFPSQLLPANTAEFTIAGHCSPECTRAGLPEEGVHLFNYFFHAHLAGRKMRLHHYRDNKELPWLANDDRYNFNYQQTRNLREEIVLKPGDQLSLECVFDTTGRENATFAGLGTKEEMCQVFSWYYPKQPLKICSSAYEPIGTLYNDVLGLGIEDIDMSEHYFDPIITMPLEMAGKHVSQVLNEKVEWTPQLIQTMQKLLHNEPHMSVGICTPEGARKGPIRKGRVNLMSNKPSEDEIIDWVSFPEVDEIYQPEDVCNTTDTTTTPTDTTITTTDTTDTTPTDNTDTTDTTDTTTTPTDTTDTTDTTTTPTDTTITTTDTTDTTPTDNTTPTISSTTNSAPKIVTGFTTLLFSCILANFY